MVVNMEQSQLRELIYDGASSQLDQIFRI